MSDFADDPLDYYRNRERLELELAKSASSRPIQNIHREMAARYRDIIDHLEHGNSLLGLKMVGES